jgi:tRNA A37 threonylcarbamoyladenosine dehydratase
VFNVRYEFVIYCISKRRKLVSYAVASKLSQTSLVNFTGIHKEIYNDILRGLRDAVRRKHPQKLGTKS